MAVATCPFFGTVAERVGAVGHDALAAWLIEAAVRYSRKPVAVSGLQSMPVLFPFNFMLPLTYILSNSPILELRSEGSGHVVVAMKGYYQCQARRDLS